MARRLLTFDFLRGFAIIWIAVFHVLVLTCDLFPQAKSDPFSLPFYYLAIMVACVVFGHWRGFFLIISGVVHIHAMTTAIRKGADRKRVWLSQVTFGVALWGFGMFREVFLNEWSMPRSMLKGATFLEALGEQWAWIYLMEAIEAVAWAIIITSTVFFFLTANNGIEKTKRNAIIFGALALFAVFFAPVLNQMVTAHYGVNVARKGPEDLDFLHGIGYVFWFFKAPFIGYCSPLFPMLGYSFTGVVVGLLLTGRNVPRTLPRNVSLAAVGLIVFGALWLWLVTGLPEDLGKLITFQFHPTWFVFVATGMQLLMITGMLRLIEFNPRVNVQTALRWTKPGRRWGVTALTVYSFLCVEYLVRAGMGLVFPQFDWMADNTLPFGWTVFLIAVVLLVWDVTLRLWEQVNFKYSFEWLLTWLAKRNKPFKRFDRGDLMNVQGILRDPMPVLFVDPEAPQPMPVAAPSPSRVRQENA